MAEEGKKISFGFSKSVKKTVFKSTVPQEQKRVDYIDCLDDKSIKVIGGEEKKDEPLVIPMLGSKTWHERIVNKIDADVFEPKINSQESGNETEVKVKEEIIEESMEVDRLEENTPAINVGIKKETQNEIPKPPETLEEQAAQEILRDIQKGDDSANKPNVLTLPVTENQSLRGEKESTLEDYESIPIDAFGIAMLRGMGWKEGKGIGKNEKLVQAAIPELRPKGMGLGADKVANRKENGQPKTKEEEQLKLIKGAFIKIIAGKQKENYGQIEGLDDDAGRLIVKMALGGNTVSVNEFMVQAVTKAEFSKNSKVINSAKYEEYKNKDSDFGEGKSEIIVSSGSEWEDESRKKIKKEHRDKGTSDKRKKKKHRRHSSSENSSPERRSRKRRHSNSESDHKPKKSKKSKKHKSRDSSPERSSRKNTKKDKEREKRRDRRSSESPERRKHRKHKRSRSPRR